MSQLCAREKKSDPRNFVLVKGHTADRHCSVPKELPRMGEFARWNDYATFGGWGGVLVSSGCCNKMPQTGGLSDRLAAHTSGGWEVQGQGAGRLGCWWGPSSWLADGCLLHVFSQGTESEREQTSSGLSSLSYKGTNPITRGLPSWPHLNLIISHRPHPRIPAHGAFGPQHTNFGLGGIQRFGLHQGVTTSLRRGLATSCSLLV